MICAQFVSEILKDVLAMEVYNDIDDNEKPFTRDDVHALATSSMLTEREREILYGDSIGSYDEFSDLFDKLMDELDDYDSAMVLRTKHKDVIAKHAEKTVNALDQREEPHDPVLTTNQEMYRTAAKIASAFPDTYNSTRKMISNYIDDNRHITYAQKPQKSAERKSGSRRNDPKVKDALETLSFMRKLFYNDRSVWRVSGESITDWRSYCNTIKKAILSKDLELSEFAINKINWIAHEGMGRYPDFYFSIERLASQIQDWEPKSDTE